MQNLIQQEQFELEVLDRLNSKRLLDRLVFGGGTMLRLCFGLDRFSVDMDFWVVKELEMDKLFTDVKECLAETYTLTDVANKFYTLLFEFKSREYPRSLKIEIRKETKKIKTGQAIAYSQFSQRQVFLRVVSLEEMMQAKIEALLGRREIRDAFDLEFLLKKGIPLPSSTEMLQKVFACVESFTRKDYTVKLGSLLEDKQRNYYTRENFKLLKSAITEIMAKG